MTEDEWLVCTDPGPMLESLYGKGSPRKMRLAAVGFCRRVAHLLPTDERCRLAMEVAESYADRQVRRRELAAAHTGVEAVSKHTLESNCRLMAGALAANAIYWATHPTMRHYPGWAAEAARKAVGWAGFPPAAAAFGGDLFRPPSSREASKAAEGIAQAILLRCIFDNPFRPLSPLSPSLLDWHGGAAVQLARAIYEERSLPSGHLDAGRLAVLADMLEEAGATDAQLLSHLRSPGPHVRGCVAVDAVLGRG
jgi:hypothetical protein